MTRFTKTKMTHDPPFTEGNCLVKGTKEMIGRLKEKGLVNSVRNDKIRNILLRHKVFSLYVLVWYS